MKEQGKSGYIAQSKSDAAGTYPAQTSMTPGMKNAAKIWLGLGPEARGKHHVRARQDPVYADEWIDLPEIVYPSTAIELQERIRSRESRGTNSTPEMEYSFLRKAAVNDNVKDPTTSKNEHYPYQQQYQPGYATDEKIAEQLTYDKVSSVASAVEEFAKIKVNAVYGAFVSNKKPKTAITTPDTGTPRYKLKVQRYGSSPKEYVSRNTISYTSSLTERLRRRTSTGSIDDIFDKAA